MSLSAHSAQATPAVAAAAASPAQPNVLWFGEHNASDNTALTALRALPGARVRSFDGGKPEPLLSWFASARDAELSSLAVVVLKLGAHGEGLRALEELHAQPRHRHIVWAVFSHTACTVASTHKRCLRAGAALVTRNVDHLLEFVGVVLQFGALSSASGVLLRCPVCQVALVDAQALYHHFPRFHGDQELKSNRYACPLCADGFARTNITYHIMEEHGHKVERSVRGYSFACVICVRRSDRRVLLVNEFGCEGWWIPAGRVDADESFVDAAIRETWEEAGVKIRLTGVLKVEYNRSNGKTRVIFTAEPLDESAVPKQIPDYESQEARWFTVDEALALEWRSRYELPYIEAAVAERAKIFDLDVFDFH